MNEDRYRIKETDYEKPLESIPTKEQTSISPYGISKAELDAAHQVLSSNQKLPSFELPTFHFYNKSTEVNEISDELRGKYKEVAIKDKIASDDNARLGKLKGNIPDSNYWKRRSAKRVAGIKQANETNMGGPMFTWNKDSKAFHNPHSDPTKNVERTTAREGLRKALAKKSVERLDAKMAKRAAAMKKEAVDPEYKKYTDAGYKFSHSTDTHSVFTKDGGHTAHVQHNKYSKDAVDKAIASSNRAGRKIGGKEAKKIHAVLKGWRKD